MNGRLVVPERSPLKTAALVCSIVSTAACGVPLLIFLVLLAFVAVAAGIPAESAGVVILTVAILTFILGVYVLMLVGVIKAHRTLVLISAAWFGNSVVMLITIALSMVQHIGAANFNLSAAGITIVMNAVDLLVSVGIGVVFLLYHKGIITNRYIAVVISAVGFLTRAVPSVISVVNVYNTYSGSSALAMGLTVIILLFSGLYTIVNLFSMYGTVFFLGLSMHRELPKAAASFEAMDFDEFMAAQGTLRSNDIGE